MGEGTGKTSAVVTMIIIDKNGYRSKNRTVTTK